MNTIEYHSKLGSSTGAMRQPRTLHASILWRFALLSTKFSVVLMVIAQGAQSVHHSNSSHDGEQTGQTVATRTTGPAGRPAGLTYPARRNT